MIITLGLEAAEPSLIKKYMQAGFLRNITKIAISGNGLIPVVSASSISSGSTWASVNLGVNPGKHGVGFYHRQLKTGTYNIVKQYADELEVPPFWRHLMGTDKKALILDPPEIYPEQQFNGKILVGWGAEGLNYKRSSYPQDFLSDCIKRFGDHPLTGWFQQVPTTADGWDNLFGLIQKGLQQRIDMYKVLIKEESPDLVYCSIAETHWIGHFFWHFIESAHENYEAGLAEKYGDSILKIYEMCDELVGHFMEKYPDATIILFSNTGMGANFSGRHFTHEILTKMAVLPAKTNKITPQSKWGVNGIKKVEDILGARNIEKIKMLFPEKFWDTWTRKLLTAGNNWKESMAFEVPSDYTSNIRINLIGREPDGKVHPGEEYEKLCHRIQKVFEALIDPDSAKPVVKEVLHIHKLYQGNKVENLPDIAVVWESDKPITKIFSPEFGLMEGRLNDKRSGAHMPYGFILSNQPFTEGKIPNKIEDLAPTLLSLLNVPVPEYMDGEPCM